MPSSTDNFYNINQYSSSRVTADRYYDTNLNSSLFRSWGYTNSQISYIITRFLKSTFTGPVRPTPGTAVNAYPGEEVYQAIRKPAKDNEGFKGRDKFYTDRDPKSDFNWPSNTSNIPIDIEIRNLAIPDYLSGQEDKIILVGVNPGNLSDSGSQPEFSSARPMGRSSPYQLYNGGGARTVKATVKLHRDMFSYMVNILNTDTNKNIKEQFKNYENYKEESVVYDSELGSSVVKGSISNSPQQFYQYLQKQAEQETLNEFRNTINWFRALQYPVYANGGVIAPRAFMRIGKFLQIQGYPSVDITYENIYTEGYPVSVDIGISITEVMQESYDQTAIRTNNINDLSVGMNCVEWSK